jgi:hypothetical protein
MPRFCSCLPSTRGCRHSRPGPSVTVTVVSDQSSPASPPLACAAPTPSWSLEVIDLPSPVRTLRSPPVEPVDLVVRSQERASQAERPVSREAEVQPFLPPPDDFSAFGPPPAYNDVFPHLAYPPLIHARGTLHELPSPVRSRGRPRGSTSTSASELMPPPLYPSAVPLHSSRRRSRCTSALGLSQDDFYMERILTYGSPYIYVVIPRRLPSSTATAPAAAPPAPRDPSPNYRAPNLHHVGGLPGRPQTPTFSAGDDDALNPNITEVRRRFFESDM